MSPLINTVTRTLHFKFPDGQDLVLEDKVSRTEDGWVAMPLIRNAPVGMTTFSEFEVTEDLGASTGSTP